MKPNLFALAGRKRELRRSAEALLAKGDAMTTEESAAYERILSQLKENEAQIIEAEGERERERTALLPAGTHMIEGGGGGTWRPAGAEDRGLHAGGKTYREMFPGLPLMSNGFKSISEFFRAFHHADKMFDPRLMAASQVEDTPSLGGFAVPTEYSAMILDRALEQEIVRPRAQSWPMKSETLKIPGLDNFDHSSNLYGGFQALWAAEASTLSPQTNKLYQVGLTANKLALLGRVSNELLADAVSGYEAAYTSSMIAAVAWFNDWYMLNGNGSGQPLGVLNDPALIVVTSDTTDPTDGISYIDVANMFARLHPACMSNSVWVANSTCIPQLLRMTNAVENKAGTENVGGSAVPVLNQTADGKFSMLTRPVLFTEKLPAVGDQGCLLLVDFSQYAIGSRPGLGVEKSAHAGFLSDETVFRLLSRVDGQGTWKNALTPKVGDSLSWVVALGTSD